MVKDTLTQPISIYKAFQGYVSDSRLAKPEYYITESQYLSLDFMNEIPEIVCDILYYLSGFVHYRTNRFSQEVYEKFLKQ